MKLKVALWFVVISLLFLNEKSECCEVHPVKDCINGTGTVSFTQDGECNIVKELYLALECTEFKACRGHLKCGNDLNRFGAETKKLKVSNKTKIEECCFIKPLSVLKHLPVQDSTVDN